MNFLDSSRVRSNMSLAAKCLLDVPSSQQTLHVDFIRALNSAQGTTIQLSEEGPFIEFGNPELVSFLTKKGVFSEEETRDDRHLLTAEDQNRTRQNIEAALR